MNDLVTLRVHILVDGGGDGGPPPAQRQRVEGGAGAGAGAGAGERTIDVRCRRQAVHLSAVLGEQLQRGGDVVHLNMETAQEARLVRLLLEAASRPIAAAAAAHDTKYLTADDGMPLPPGTLLGLAEVAASLNFQGGAIEQIMGHLGRQVQQNYDAAAAFINGLPSALAAHPSSRAARLAVTRCLAEGIKTRDQRYNHLYGQQQRDEAELRRLSRELARGRDALALCLGPVGEFFAQQVGAGSGDATFKDYSVIPLRGNIKSLPYAVAWHLLASDRLQVETENEAYLLAACWATQSDHVAAKGKGAKGESFKALASQVRWQFLTVDFLANVVAHCPLLRVSTLLPSALTAALVHRDVPFALLHNAPADMPTAGARRGKAQPAQQASWTLRTGIQVEDCDSLAAVGASLCKVVGEVNGYPLALKVSHCKDDASGDETLAIYLSVRFSHSTSIGDGANDARVVGNALERCLALKVEMEVTGWGRKRAFTQLFKEGGTWGYRDVLDWALAARGTQHFPHGRCEVELTVTLAVRG